MISDQERYQILDAVIKLCEQKGVAISARELHRFHAETTGGSIEEKLWLVDLKTLKTLGYIDGKILEGNEGIQDMHGIEVTADGIEYVFQHQNDIGQIQLVSKIPENIKKPWLTTNKKWLIRTGIMAAGVIISLLIYLSTR